MASQSPSTKGKERCQSEASPHTPQNLTSSLHSRVARVRSALTDLSADVAVRSRLLHLSASRPYSYRAQSRRNNAWKQRAEYLNHLHIWIEREVNQIGDKASESKVEWWEKGIEELKKEASNQVEIVAEHDAWDEMEEDAVGLFGDWNWKDALERTRGGDKEEEWAGMVVDPLDATKKIQGPEVGLYKDLYANVAKPRLGEKKPSN